MRGNHAYGRVSGRRGENFSRPGRRTAAFPDREHRSDEGAHHVVAERIRYHAANGYPVHVPLPLQAPQRPHGRRSLPPPTKRGKVMLAEQQQSRLIHSAKIQRPRIPECVMPPQRVRTRRVIADPIGIPPPKRRKPRVKSVGRELNSTHPKVRRQRPREPPQRHVSVHSPSISRQVSMRHLPPRMHPRISPPSHSKPHSFRQPQHMPERLRQHALDSPPPRLSRPPREPAPVIRHANPDPHKSPTDHVKPPNTTAAHRSCHRPPRAASVSSLSR